jgi:predicted anti-sigma-YlaC factor YlaD
MKCEDIKGYFDDFILGETDPAMEIAINEHLLECPACRQELGEQEALFADLRRTTACPPPERAWHEVRRSIQALSRDRKPRFIRWFAPIVYVTAAFLAGMVLMRAADVISLRSKESPALEIRNRPSYRIPYSDTVQFYAAPAKNLAKI